MIYGKDISQYNNYTPGSEEFVLIKIGGGDAGLYFDSKATVNYTNAKNAGKVVGGYWFAGGTDPVAEADYFVRGMSPIADGDLFALDWEIQHTDPVGWCLSFVNEVHAKTGVWCLVYLNISTVNAYDWSPVLANCGLWLAAPSIAYEANAPIHHPYVLQQGPIVDGIDQDVAFLTREQLLTYGWPTVPTVYTPPAPVSTPVATVTPAPEPVVTPVQAPVVVPTPEPVQVTTSTPITPLVAPTVPTTITTNPVVESVTKINVTPTPTPTVPTKVVTKSTSWLSLSIFVRLWHIIFG